MERISPATLKEWLNSDNPPAVVDVRDEDYFGGHIRDAINFPSETFSKDLSKLEEILQKHDRVVFYCQLSQVRGPTCAKKYIINSTSTSQKVYVLNGGFNNWAQTYNGELTDGFIPDLYR